MNKILIVIIEICLILEIVTSYKNQRLPTTEHFLDPDRVTVFSSNNMSVPVMK
jgi:hypothetical protein